MFTLPQFNQTAKVWRAGADPRTATPVHVDIPCQPYLFSRQWIAHHEPDINYLVPSMQVRFPKGSFSPLISDVYLLSFSAFAYYRGVWAERVHPGFPNEYFMVVCVQCDDTSSTPRAPAKWDPMT
jgi:hypothetical protein